MPVTTSTGTVFIVQQPRPSEKGWLPDFSTARDYGKLEYVFDASDRAFADRVAACKKVYARLLRKFNEDTDYLLCTNFGDPFCNYIAVMGLAHAGFKKVKFLYWNKTQRNTIGRSEDGHYIPIELDVNDFPAIT